VLFRSMICSITEIIMHLTIKPKDMCTKSKGDKQLYIDDMFTIRSLSLIIAQMLADLLYLKRFEKCFANTTYQLSKNTYRLCYLLMMIFVGNYVICKSLVNLDS
jgi:hypothetical protein